MWERNDGKGESNILQNQFTVYLNRAIDRKIRQYENSQIRLQQYEIPLEMQDHSKIFLTEPDMILDLPLIDQLGNIKLQQLLKQAKKRDLYIFLAKTLEDRSFVEIADKLSISYNTVTSVYYRMVQRLKKELGGEDE